MDVFKFFMNSNVKSILKDSIHFYSMFILTSFFKQGKSKPYVTALKAYRKSEH